MIVADSIKVDKRRRTIKGIAKSFYKMFKDLETEMKNDSNFMMEVNKTTNRNIMK